MQHDFGPDFQRGVIRLMLVDDAFAQRALEYLNVGFFSVEALGWIFKRYHAYWHEYLAKLTDTVLREELRRCSQDKQGIYGPEVAMVLDAPATDGQYIKAKLEEFVRVNVFAESHRKSATLFMDKKYVESFDEMRRAMDRINQIEFEKPQRSFFFEELEERQERRVRYENDASRIPWITGIPMLDKATNGGALPGEVWAVLAQKKRGKTTWLVNQGFHATRILRQPTLHIMLEGNIHQVEDKYDTLFAYEHYRQVRRGDITAAVYADMVSEYMLLRRKLVIRCLNDFRITMLDVIAEIEKLRALGFFFKKLILDYVDLLRSRDTNVSDELTHQLDGQRDLKRYSLQHDLATWTAWQAQRPPSVGMDFKEHYLSTANMADCYAKSRVVDFYGSLNSTDQELQRGSMRVYAEGYRDSILGKYYRVQSDLQTMRMFTGVEEFEKPKPQKKGAEA